MRTFGAVATIFGGLIVVLGFLGLTTNLLDPSFATLVVGVGIVAIVVGQLFMKVGEEY